MEGAVQGKIGTTYEVAYRPVLPKRIEAFLKCPQISELVNTTFSRHNFESEFAEMAARLTSSGYEQLLALLPIEKRGKLTVDTPFIEMDIFGLCELPTLSSPSSSSSGDNEVVIHSPTKNSHAPIVVGEDLENCNVAIIIAETTTSLMCGHDLFLSLPWADGRLDDWRKDAGPTKSLRLDNLIFKLLQLERQVTLLEIHYGTARAIAHAYLIRSSLATKIPPPFHLW